MAEKRKNNTSREARNRYDAAHFKTVTFKLGIDIVDAFRKKCAETGTPQASVIREAMQEFIKKN